MLANQIATKIARHVRAYLRRKNALVKVKLSLLAKNLDLIHRKRIHTVMVPIPIVAFKNLLQNRDQNLIAVPSNQLKEAMIETNQMPHGHNTFENLAENIVLDAEVHVF